MASLQVVSYTEGVRERCHSSWLATFMPAALADGGAEQLPDSAACAACRACIFGSGASAVISAYTFFMCGGLVSACLKLAVPVSLQC